MKARKILKNKYAFFASLFCVAAYFLLGALLFPKEEKSVHGTASGVPYQKLSGEYIIFAACEELSEYSAVYIDFDMKSISVYLFPNRETAKSYGFSYNRYIEYTKQVQIEIIGRIGGIVIDKDNWYNIEDKGRERIFGNRVAELSQQGIETRTAVAEGFIEALLSSSLRKTDFLYVAENCKTDISYADFYRYFDAACSFINDISVRVVE